jgi:hypothetical protein
MLPELPLELLDEGASALAAPRPDFSGLAIETAVSAVTSPLMAAFGEPWLVLERGEFSKRDRFQECSNALAADLRR